MSYWKIEILGLLPRDAKPGMDITTDEKRESANQHMFPVDNYCCCGKRTSFHMQTGYTTFGEEFMRNDCKKLKHSSIGI